MKPRKQFEIASRMEGGLSAIEARAQLLISIGCEVSEDFDGAIGSGICQLGYDILRDARKLEKRRTRLFHALHPAAYPEPADTTDPN